MPNVGKSSPWTTESIGNSVTRIDFKHRLWVLVTSDWHWDSVHCNRDALEEDLKTAVRLNAAVLSIGDHFDVMGGKYDPRSNGKYDLRPELQTGDYFDAVVKTGCGLARAVSPPDGSDYSRQSRDSHSQNAKKHASPQG